MKECEKIIEILYEHDQLISEMMKREKEMIMFSIREILHGNSSEYSFEIRKKALFDLLIIVREGYSLDIKERWGLFLSANHIMFVTPEYDDLIIEFRRSYNSLVKRIEDLVWGDADPAIRVGEREDVQENRSVVVISSQFLSEKHSQSQSVLEYACTISEGMGMPVMMINDAGTHCDTSWMRYNYIPGYCDFDAYSYKGAVIPFYQARNVMPDLNEISVMCREIKKMNPVLVLNVGGGSVVADMCRHFTRTASIPCSYDIPFSMSEYLILPRNTKESDSRIIENLLPYQKLVNTIYNYSRPEDSDMLYDRKMFNINENAFVVATVGFRLDKEMDEAFLKAAGQILDLDERISFVIFGEVEDRDRITGCVGKTDQIVFAGEVDDSAQCIKLADVYINPERAGGGRSAFEALYSGIPVITLKYGDVWGVTGDEFAVDDYDEMVKRVFSYMSDRSFYRRMSALSQSRAYELADMETTVKKIFDDLGVSYPRK